MKEVFIGLVGSFVGSFIQPDNAYSDLLVGNTVQNNPFLSIKLDIFSDNGKLSR